MIIITVYTDGVLTICQAFTLMLIYLILTTNLCPHFTCKETEAQRDSVNFPKSYSRSVKDEDLNLKTVWLQGLCALFTTLLITEACAI